MTPTPIARARMLVGRRVAGRYAGATFSQEGEDLILGRLFEDHPTGFYVDVGAHHPQRFSNTYLLYLRGWRGLNIDPLPGTAARWRRARPGDLTIEVGIGRSSERRPYFMFDDPALNTFDPARAAELRATTRYRQTSVRQVTIRPLSDVLDQHLPSGTSIDIVSIDVEGLEEEVFETMDIGRHRPRAICFERLHREPGTGLVGGPIASTLDEHGYVFCAATVHSLIYVIDELGR